MAGLLTMGAVAGPAALLELTVATFLVERVLVGMTLPWAAVFAANAVG